MDDQTSMRGFIPQDEVVQEEESQVSEPVQEVAQEEPGQGEPTQPSDSFTGNFDPKTLPPELLSAYKQMQGDYTRKTQELSAIRERATKYDQYESLINFLTENPQALDKVLGIGVSQEPSVEPEYPDDPVAYAQKVREETLAEVQKLLAREREEAQTQAKIDRDIEEAEKVDPRLTTDPGFGLAVAGIVSNDPDVVSGRKSMAQATKDAVAYLDGLFNKRLMEEKQKLSEQARQKRAPVSGTSSAPTVDATREISSMRDAARVAGLID